MLCQVESGNVTLLLTMLTGAQQSEIEAMLMNGVRPAEVANHAWKIPMKFVAISKKQYCGKTSGSVREQRNYRKRSKRTF